MNRNRWQLSLGHLHRLFPLFDPLPGAASITTQLYTPNFARTLKTAVLGEVARFVPLSHLIADGEMVRFRVDCRFIPANRLSGSDTSLKSALEMTVSPPLAT